MKRSPESLDIASLAGLYADGSTTPTAVVGEIWRRSDEWADPALWIHRLPLAELRRHAARVEARGRAAQPLYGIPFAIKDNIDLAGTPTTAACPGFSRTPGQSSPVVDRLIEAGAIPVGKTNLDQFATGLVGTRSPYGTPRNPFSPLVVPGGSSSGSAVAVAAGLVSFALGTDTAGSGRIPAAFNNLVGMKPTRGWWSTRGVVPACRSLDCVSVFTLTVDDAVAVANVAGGFDPLDPYSREGEGVRLRTLDLRCGGQELQADPFRFGVPAPSQMQWFGDPSSPALYDEALRRMEGLGGVRVEIDFAPFAEAARLLYEGPWIAERWVALKDFFSVHADSFHPVTRRIVEQGARPTAADAFAAQDRLQALRRAVEPTWEQVDALLLPTAAFHPTIEQVEADPVWLNSRLGTYTNFTNLLDLAALAVPSGFRPDGLPFGISLIGPAWSDGLLSRIGSAFHRTSDLTLGATGSKGVRLRTFDLRSGGQELQSDPLPAAEVKSSQPDPFLPLAVVGAHLRGQPLNHQLTGGGGRFIRADRTADCYRLFALAGSSPPKPGLVRGLPGSGGSIEIEIWELPESAWAAFVAAIPPPLGIGTLVLADGSTVKGFLCESAATFRAEDITRHGGWRAYLSGSPL